VVGGHGAKLHRQLRPARGGELIGVQLGNQTVFQARFQHPSALDSAKGTDLMKGVAEHRRVMLGDGRYHLLHHQVEIAFRVARVFARDHIGPQQGRYHVNRVLGVHLAIDIEQAQLVIGTQPVPALRFHRGDAVTKETVQSMPRRGDQHLSRRVPGGVDGLQDAAARRSNVLVGGSRQPQFELVGPVALKG
jgi:hypothetical protein